MPKQINTPWAGHGLVQLFGLKGRYQPVLDEVIVPVTVVDAGATTVERPAQAQESAAAVAAEFGYMQLENPTGSGVIITVQRLFITGYAGQVLICVPGFTIVPGSSANAVKGWRDTSIAGSPAGLATYGTHAGAVTGQYRFLIGTSGRDSVNDNPYHAVLEPGSTMVVSAGAVNNVLTVGVQWSERYVTEG